MRGPAPVRVLGPYRNGVSWRVVVLRGTVRQARIAPTYEQAQALIRALRAELAVPPPRPLSAALRDYRAYLRSERNLQPRTVELTLRQLGAFLSDPAAPLAAVTPQAARRLARFTHPSARRIRHRKRPGVQRAVLAKVRSFYAWTVERGDLRHNPFDGVQPRGLIGTGQAPLPLAAARRFAAVALDCAAGGDFGAVAALLVLGMGLRSSQILPLRVGDIDAAGQRLRVVGGREAWLPIPALLWPPMQALVQDRAPTDLLFGAGRRGEVRPTNFLWRTVARLCTAAKVAQTSPRSLRALHRILARTPAPSSHQIVRLRQLRTRRHGVSVPSASRIPAMLLAEFLGLSVASDPHMLTELSQRQRRTAKPIRST